MTGDDDAEDGEGLSVAMLGPLDVVLDGRTVPLTTGRLRTILAVLAMSAGRPVPVKRLAEAVWDERLPASAKGSLQTYVGRLRRILGSERISTSPAGFTLRIPAEAVDTLHFGRLLDRAATADAVAERALLTAAVALWRGEPFADVASAELERTEQPRLTERYLGALERLTDLDLAAGHSAELAAPLRELTARFPLRESLWIRLLAVLRRNGRHAEALERYEAIRARLAEELGSEPGAELRAAYAELLAGDEPVGITTGDVPRQLPADVAGFVGRAGALRVLDALAAERGGGRGSAVAAVIGTAGVGKTSLAVHWAHRAAGHFPDGQLYVNLRGFAPDERVVGPTEAIRGFLDALGVPKDRVPAGLGPRTGLYRSLLADRRVLVLLDNARDAEQVRPLLPGGGRCLTLVTSRSRLTGLVAAEAAVPVGLDVLADDEARELLRARLRTDRSAGPEADEVIAWCAGLPLALVIVAARAALRPGPPLTGLAAELRATTGLDALDSGEESTSARSVFSWSYRALGDEAARMFRLLGLHPGAEVSPAAAASLAGLLPGRAARALTELTAAHLLTEPAPGRYGRHDLLRGYARELTETHDSPDERDTAVRRLLDHYLHSAFTAMRLLQPQRAGIEIPAHDAYVTLAEPADAAEALAWFTDEHAALTAMVHIAHERGFDDHTVELAWTLRNYLDWQGHWDDWAAVLATALLAAERSERVLAQVSAHRGLARVLMMRGEPDTAYEHLSRALVLSGKLDDPTEAAHTHQSLSVLFDTQDRYADAREHARQALDLFRAVGHRRGIAVSLNSVGWCCAHLGESREALAYCRDALALQTELGAPHGRAGAWDSIGYAHHRLGEYGLATEAFGNAAAFFAEVGDRHGLATALRHLGDSAAAAGDPLARGHYERALSILDELGHADAEEVRRALAATG